MGSTISTTFDVSNPALAFRHKIPAADVLVFGQGNGKLHPAISHFSLPAGWACPGARLCLAKAVEREGGKWGVEDGPEVSFRCFSASEEARYPQVREIRWHNFNTLRRYADRERTPAGKVAAMAALILASLPVLESPFDGFSVDGTAYSLVCRLHIGGDFWSQSYFDAWLLVAARRPDVLCYGYTKSLPFWSRRLDVMPRNLVLTASQGGRYDHLIGKHNLRFARVVFTEAEAAAAGLELDRDDSHAMRRGPSFGLLLHGPQPKATPAAKALAALRAAGDWGYGRLAARRRREKARRLALPLVG